MPSLILERHKITPVLSYEPTVHSAFMERGHIPDALSSIYLFRPFMKFMKNTLNLMSLYEQGFAHSTC